ncbi:MAG TPA: heme exporter protein CcmD [Hyphomonas sp.]|nr:heme exporter protein CcmD [Hyphomonas sp.]HRK66717.1 heme exporter protein CcmD [Hyphomonas sp.]
MPEFDKNAVYIWACFGIGALLIAAAVIQSLLAARAARQKLERLEKAEAAK